MKARSVSEIAIQAEMDETGLNRLQAIRRIRSRAQLHLRAPKFGELQR